MKRCSILICHNNSHFMIHQVHFQIVFTPNFYEIRYFNEK